MRTELLDRRKRKTRLELPDDVFNDIEDFHD
jgi:hypothetical protein